MAHATSNKTPKFTSFKSKDSEGRTRPRVQWAETPLLPRASSIEEVQHDDRPRKRQRRDNARSGRMEHNINANSTAAGSASIAEDVEESDLFIADRRGDQKNVEYGGLHRYSVPSYYRRGHGCLIGTPFNVKVDRDKGTENTVSLRNVEQDSGQRKPRLLTSKRGGSDAITSRLIVKVSHDDIVEDELQNDFIPLRPGYQRRSREHLSAIDASAVDYRSIEGKVEASNEPDDTDLELDSDYDVGALFNETEAGLRKENAALSNRTKGQPTNADAWLELLEHQRRLLRPGDDVTTLSRSEQRALADVRVSICEQALKHVTKDHQGYECLLTTLLDAGNVLWERSRVDKKWQEILREHPTSGILWTKYIDIAQTEHAGFKFESCREVYLKCLQVLQDTYNSATPKSKQSIALTYLYVLLRFCAFARDAGYDELALAMWQIVLEYRCCSPEEDEDRGTKLRSLEDFWDSDVPRIGEHGARGWREHTASEERTARSVSTIKVETIDSTRPMASFATVEQRLHKFLHLPATTDDESVAEDPFRAVLFSDLKEVIMTLPDDLPRHAPIQAFLLFMKLPPLPSDGQDAATHQWQADQFLRSKRTNPGSGRFSHDREGVPASPVSSIPSCRSMVHTLFEQLQEAISENTESADFVARVLERLVAAMPGDDSVSEYYIALRSLREPEGAAKTAKRLLRARPSSLRLYNVYALSEAYHGRLNKARAIWDTALRTSSTWDECGSKDAIYLQHSRIMTELHAHAEANSLGCLVTMCEPKSNAEGMIENAPMSAAARLRISQHLDIGFERAFHEQQADHAVLYANCHAWFSYLVDDKTVEATLPVFAKYGNKLTVYPSAMEQLHQLKAALMKYHIDRRRAYRPALVRSELEKSIKLFPDNSMLLDMHSDVRARFRIDDRMRTSLSKTGPSETCMTVISSYSIIMDDMQRASVQGAGSTANSVRAVFRAALLSPESTVKHSAALWTMWLQFELTRRPETTESIDKALQRAKQVFLEGMRHLPWSKTWIIEGLSAFTKKGDMLDRKLREVYDVLAEREIRVRANPEEMEAALAQDRGL